VIEDNDHIEIRDAIRKLCTNFPNSYWRELDRERAYPTDFVKALNDAGYLAILIPEEHGGSGLPLSAACAVLEEIQMSGGNGGACHAQMYTMGTLLRHGSDVQKQKYLPQIAASNLRLQAFGVTEPGSGTDTTRIRMTAKRQGNHSHLRRHTVATPSGSAKLVAPAARTDGDSFPLGAIPALNEHGDALRAEFARVR